MIEGHGDDLYRYGGKVKFNFSTNILSGVNHEGLKKFLASRLDVIGSYPEPSPSLLEREIAMKEGVSRENVVVTNGATDAVYRLAFLGSGGRSAVLRPTFREYQDACRLHGHDVSFFDSIGRLPSSPDMIWICNPNNPTGQVIPIDDIIGMCAAHKESLIVIDQAYSDYCPERLMTSEEAVALGNTVLLRSLTKRYCVPGLRIGYAVTSAEIAGKLRNCSMPWVVNALAIESARYLIGHDDDYPIDATGLRMEAERVASKLRAIGMEVYPTDCNFMLCRLPYGSAAELKSFLMDHHGLLIRDASNFEGLDAGCFRIAVQGRPADDILLEAIRQYLKAERREKRGVRSEERKSK